MDYSVSRLSPTTGADKRSERLLHQYQVIMISHLVFCSEGIEREVVIPGSLKNIYPVEEFSGLDFSSFHS
jgi:hypothetical protein